MSLTNKAPAALLAKRTRLRVHAAELEKAIDAMDNEISRLSRQAEVLGRHRAHAAYSKAPWLVFPSRLQKATAFARQYQGSIDAKTAAAVAERTPQIQRLQTKRQRTWDELFNTRLALQRISNELDEPEPFRSFKA